MVHQLQDKIERTGSGRGCAQCWVQKTRQCHLMDTQRVQMTGEG